MVIIQIDTRYRKDRLMSSVGKHGTLTEYGVVRRS